MIDTTRFKNIKTLQDIKLEKARLRYDLLLAENALSENIYAIQQAFSYVSLFSRIADGYAYAQRVVSKISRFYRRIFRKD
jgi:hypothetical protein